MKKAAKKGGRVRPAPRRTSCGVDTCNTQAHQVIETQASPVVGTIHPKGTMFLRNHVGVAAHQDGAEYELSFNLAGCHPIVWNKASGLYFTLSWEAIINMARAAGIDKKGAA